MTLLTTYIMGFAHGALIMGLLAIAAQRLAGRRKSGTP